MSCKGFTLAILTRRIPTLLGAVHKVRHAQGGGGGGGGSVSVTMHTSEIMHTLRIPSVWAEIIYRGIGNGAN